MRKACVIAVILVLGATGYVSAQEREGPFHLQGKVGIAGSLVSSYITPDITLLYSPRPFSFGGGLKGFIGREYGDAYLAPYGTIEFTWFYLNLGVSMQIKNSDEPMAHPSTEEPPLYLSTGFYPRVKLGPGRLLFGVNVDLIATDSPILEGDNFLATIILTSLGAGMGLLKYEAGIGYRFSL